MGHRAGHLAEALTLADWHAATPAAQPDQAAKPATGAPAHPYAWPVPAFPACMRADRGGWRQ